MTEGWRLDHRPEYERLAHTLATMLIADHAPSNRARLIIAVAGESGSGKSITATSLARELDAHGLPSAVIHQDDYFVLPPRANHEHRLQSLANVGPQEVDLDLLHSHVSAFREGRNGVTAPMVDYPTDRFLTRQLDFAALAVLIVEGTYVLRLPDVDVRIFLNATCDDTRARRRARNRDIDAPIVDQVLAIEHQLIAPQAALAQIVIDRHFQIVTPT